MTGAGALTLTGTITGLQAGQRVVNVTWNLPAALDDSQPVFLSVGIDVQVMVPPGASMVLIEPPANLTSPVILKGIDTDSGIFLHTKLAHWQSLDSSVTSFWLSIIQDLADPVQVAFF